MRRVKLRDLYFKSPRAALFERIGNVSADALPALEVFGQFDNQSHYLVSVDLLRNSSMEVEHQYEVFFHMVFPLIQHHRKMLDVGIGNGEVSKFFGIHFRYITAVDTQAESLNLLPNYHWQYNTWILKIEGSILDENLLPNEKYDLILLSHVLYYIPAPSRHALINRLSTFLEPKGVMVIAYNDGSDRSLLTDYFGGTNFNFDGFESYIDKRFTLGHSITFQEKMHAKTAETMLHIMGVCLYDANATASRDDLSAQLHHFATDDGYAMSMTTHVMILGDGF